MHQNIIIFISHLLTVSLLNSESCWHDLAGRIVSHYHHEQFTSHAARHEYQVTSLNDAIFIICPYLCNGWRNLSHSVNMQSVSRCYRSISTTLVENVDRLMPSVTYENVRGNCRRLCSWMSQICNSTERHLQGPQLPRLFHYDNCSFRCLCCCCLRRQCCCNCCVAAAVDDECRCRRHSVYSSVSLATTMHDRAAAAAAASSSTTAAAAAGTLPRHPPASQLVSLSYYTPTVSRTRRRATVMGRSPLEWLVLNWSPERTQTRVLSASPGALRLAASERNANRSATADANGYATVVSRHQLVSARISIATVAASEWRRQLELHMQRFAPLRFNGSGIFFSFSTARRSRCGMGRDRSWRMCNCHQYRTMRVCRYLEVGWIRRCLSLVNSVVDN